MVLYHYCDQHAFLSILQNQKIWLTGINNMSDYLDGRWAETMMDEIFVQLRGEFPEKVAQEFVALYRHNKINPFICCFSSVGDLLSQWRAYADDGGGFAIGFDTDVLKVSDSFPALAHSQESLATLNRVDYDVEDQRSNIAAYMRLALQQIQDGVPYVGADGGLTRLMGYAILAKNPAFSEEQEFRLTHMPMMLANKRTNKTTHMAFCLSELQYRSARNRIIPYMEYSFSDSLEKGAVKEIVVGPKNQTSDMDLRTLLGTIGYEKATILRSAASYQ